MAMIEKWMWDREMVRIWTWWPLLLSLILTAAFFPTQGTDALYLLFIACFSLMGVIYGFVGKKVKGVMEKASKLPGEAAESLMVIGRIQSPGVVVFKDTEIVLMPIVGETVTVAISDITSVKETGWLNGKKLWGKRGFYLTTPEKKKLGFAVVEEIAVRWSYKLRHAVPEMRFK